ncbi:class I SAM-dependent RNA methyltransferase [Microbacterium sp.]|uniref:class I SAM-dependent RNA methyltransferase n=1 Tax=Microbacterium sp. TaxID=51671 RepID=UPI0026314179|nr:TRAM domain-containing protein [Microbacterium sp.]
MAAPVSDLLDLDITGIAHGGTFIARHEGRVVFVSDAIPGERVRAQLRDAGADADTRRFWRADTVEVVDASAHRRAHVWAEADVSRAPADRAGGADLGHIAIDHQRGLKRQVLQEALDRFAGPGLTAPAVEAIGSSDGPGDGTRWRTRISLHVDDDGVIGPFAARSHRVIPVRSHPLARSAVEEAALTVTKAKPGRVDIVESSGGEVHVLQRPTAGRRPQAPLITEQVAGRRFHLDADGFWQVHAQAGTVLDGVVRELLSGRVDAAATHLDLYGGVGLFAASLAELGAVDIITVESSRRATDHARRNLADVGARAVTARVDRFLAAGAGAERVGTVVLDPPRSGAGRAVVEGVHALRPEAIVYVACDPVALARDLGTFRGLGWQADELRAFDLFPNSHHFEAVALLTR